MPLETDPEIRPEYDLAKYIAYVNEKYGVFGITQPEMDYVISKVRGKHLNNYHSTTIIAKIRKYTGWNMTATAMICRFAFKHRIVEL